MAHMLRWPLVPKRRPGHALRRRFLARGLDSLMTAVISLCMIAGCSTPPQVRPTAAISAPSSTVRVIDERGRPALRDARAVARKVDDGPGRTLLSRYLTRVEEDLKAPLVLGNDAQLLIDGPATHTAMFEAIAEARRYIHLETYILDQEEPGRRLADLLETKRGEGVEVRLLYDSVGSIGTPPQYFGRLQAAGVAVCEFNPVNPLKAPRGWQINNRNHRKVLVVDGVVAFTGGINISGVYSAGSGSSKHDKGSREEGWRDTHVRVEGPVVADLQHNFLEAWEEQRCPPVQEQDYSVKPRQRGDKAMRVVASDPELGRSELYVALLSAVDLAQERVWLTYGYFVPDQGMLEALKTAAGRGTDVRLVLPGYSDFWAPFHAGRSHYTDLLKAGVRIFERRNALLHAKTAVIDGVWSSVGSTNLDWRSFVHNYEADVVVLDTEFGGEMEALFRLDEKASHEIDLAQWKDRGVTPRVLEWFARRWEYFL